jgi:hypothetical protein
MERERERELCCAMERERERESCVLGVNKTCLWHGDSQKVLVFFTSIHAN